MLEKRKPFPIPTKDTSFEHTDANLVIFILESFSQKIRNPLKRINFSSLVPKTSDTHDSSRIQVAVEVLTHIENGENNKDGRVATPESVPVYLKSLLDSKFLGQKQ